MSTSEIERVPISKRLVLINSVSSVVTRLLTVGVFAWVIQYLMKRIPEEELQLLPIVISIALLLPLVNTVLNAGLARHVTEAYARNDLRRVTQIVSSQFPILVAGAAVVLLLGMGLAWNIDHILNIPDTYVGSMQFMLMLVIGRLALSMCLAAFNSGLFAQQRFVLKNGIEVCGSLLRIVLMLWLILGVGPDIKWVIVAQVASQIFILLVSTVYSIQLIPEQQFRVDYISWDICREVMSFGGWLSLSELGYMIRQAADAPILNVFSSPIAVNDFFLGSYVDARIRDLTITAGAPLIPAFTAMHAHGQTTRLASAYLRGGRIALWIAMAAAVPLMVFSYDLFSLFLGDRYSEHVDAATVLIILLLGFPFFYPTTMLTRICHATANMRPISIISASAQLFNLSLTVLLVGWFHMGAVGSALATLTSTVIVHPLFMWPLAQRLLKVSWQRFLQETLVPGLAPALVGAAVGLVCAQMITHSSWMRIAVAMPMCILGYVACLIFALRPVDRADVGRALRPASRRDESINLG